MRTFVSIPHPEGLSLSPSHCRDTDVNPRRRFSPFNCETVQCGGSVFDIMVGNGNGSEQCWEF